MIPRRFIGENIIHLPTVKTHVFTTMTGAMKNAFGGLLNERRHWTHPVIHETLVDLLMIQQKIHRGVFAVMDGTFAGDGPGPRCMIPRVKNVILASADQVAIDAISAKLMGMDPLSIKFIRLAHERGLGCGDPRDIEIVGDEDAGSGKLALRRSVQENDVRRAHAAPDLLGPAAETGRVVAENGARAMGIRGQRGVSRQLLVSTEGEGVDARGAGEPVGTLVSRMGKLRSPTTTATRSVGSEPAEIERTGMRALIRSIGILGTCLKEAPEFARTHRGRQQRRKGIRGQARSPYR